jgi:hypothetical protein
VSILDIYVETGYLKTLFPAIRAPSTGEDQEDGTAQVLCVNFKNGKFVCNYIFFAHLISSHGPSTEWVGITK